MTDRLVRRLDTRALRGRLHHVELERAGWLGRLPFTGAYLGAEAASIRRELRRRREGVR